MEISDQQIFDKILGKLEHGPIEDSRQLAEELGLDHQKLDSFIKSLLVDDYIETKIKDYKEAKLTDEGAKWASKGTPEVQLLNLLKQGEKMSKAELDEKLGADVSKIAQNQANKNKWIKSDKTHVERLVGDDFQCVFSGTLNQLLTTSDVTAVKEEILEELKKRKLVNVNTIKYYHIVKGTNYNPTKQDLTSELTADMLRDGSWKDK